MAHELSIDCARACRVVTDFIRSYFEQARCQRAVVGLSGGLDSSVVTLLTAQALGAENLTCVIMPHGQMSDQTEGDIEQILAQSGARRMDLPITEQVEAYFRRFPEADRVRRGNKMSRERMAVLYDQSAALGALVVGTSNRTEWLLGYFTLWGDMAAALWPLGCLYKSQVRQMAQHLGVPQRIIAKPPTADLWRGQTDEGELGVTYEEADRILYRVVDLGLSAQQIVAEGFAQASVERVLELMRRSEFKRRLPPMPDLRQAPPGDDFI